MIKNSVDVREDAALRGTYLGTVTLECWPSGWSWKAKARDGEKWRNLRLLSRSCPALRTKETSLSACLPRQGRHSRPLSFLPKVPSVNTQCARVGSICTLYEVCSKSGQIASSFSQSRNDWFPIVQAFRPVCADGTYIPRVPRWPTCPQTQPTFTKIKEVPQEKRDCQ